MTETREVGPVTPLWRTDPPSLGEAELIGRLDAWDDAMVYAGRLDGQPVVAALLTSGADRDSYARARFFDSVTAARANDVVVDSADEAELAPWVLVRAETWSEGVKRAELVVAPVSLRDLDPIALARGPVIRPHWARDDREPGRWRVWPLPWPSLLATGARWTFAASFAIILALAALALFLAVRLFQHQPPAPVLPPYPVPTQPSPSSPTPTTPSRPTIPTPASPSGPGASGSPQPSIV